MDSNDHGKSATRAFQKVVARCTNIREYQMLLYAMEQLENLMHDESFGEIRIKIVGGKLRQAGLEETYQGDTAA